MKRHLILISLLLGTLIHALPAQENLLIKHIESYYAEDSRHQNEPLPDTTALALKALVSLLDSLDAKDTPSLELRISAKFYLVWDLQNRRDFEAGFPHMEFLENIAEANPGLLSEVYLGHIFNLYSSGLSAIPEPEKALFYNGKAYNLYAKNNDYFNVAKSQVNASLVMTSLGRYEEAIQLAVAANQILDTVTLGENGDESDRFAPENALGLAYLEFGQYYYMLGELELAEKHNRIAIEFLSKALNGLRDTQSITQQIVILKINLANAYSKPWNKKEIFADSIITLMSGIEDYPLSGDLAGAVHITWAVAWLKKNDLEKASQHLMLGFEALGHHVRDVLDHPVLSLSDIQFKNRVAGALAWQGEICRSYYKQTKRYEYLESAVASYEQCLQLIEVIRSNFTSSSTQNVVSTKFGHFFHWASRAARECYLATGETDIAYLEKMLSFMEQGKDFLLRQALDFNSFKSTDKGGELERTINEEDSLLIELGKEDRLLQSCKLEQCDGIIAEIDRLNMDLESLRARAPAQYQEERYSKPILTLNDIRSKLLQSNATASIEFSCGDVEILAHVLTDDTILHHKINYPPNWSSLLKDYIQGMKDPSYFPGNFKKSAYELYKILLDTIIDKLPSNIERLIIIPDQKLRELVFESLLTSLPPSSVTTYGEWPFLLNKYSISYLYSYSTYQLSARPKTQPTKTLGGFIGLSGDPLPELEKACFESVDIYGGKPFKPASTSQFKDEAPDFLVLFFAMHGVIESIDNPLDYYLAFADNDHLKVGDIYFSNINARLAIFAACNTGQGFNSRGEGMVSVCRAFAAANVPSIVATMAKIPNLPHTANVLTEFATLAKNGLPLDEALKQAKLSYLKHPDIKKNNPNLQHPYYWANFILVGDSSPLHH